LEVAFMASRILTSEATNSNPSVSRVCRTCGEEKPLDAYSPNPKGKPGRSRQCKACRAAQKKAWAATESGKRSLRDAQQRYYRNNPRPRRPYKRLPSQNDATISERRKAYRRTEKARKAQAIYSARNKAKYPERQAARYAVFQAVKSGALPSPLSLACIRCGQAAAEYHHHRGYAKEFTLDVVPVCIPCHRIIDAESRALRRD
jgi:hypothetical protein